MINLLSMKKYFQKLFFGLLRIILLNSCGMYRQNIMFETKGEKLNQIIKVTEKNYIIQPGDQLGLSVYSNNGELIIDPNFQLRKEIGMTGGNNNRIIDKPEYLVRPNGTVKLPMLGIVEISGYTLAQSDSLLSQLYSEFYIESFAITSLLNRRVVVLGANGGKVISLTNENMSIIEVIALSGGIDKMAKAHNIRLIRGDLTSPQVEVIDLSSISGMKKASLYVQPNDIIYIEPVRKVVIEGVRDLSPLLSLFTTILTLSIILSRR